MAYRTANGLDLPAGEHRERMRLGCKGMRQPVPVARTGFASCLTGIRMAQHVPALEVLPVGGFLQHQVFRKMVAVVTNVQPSDKNRLAAT